MYRYKDLNKYVFEQKRIKNNKTYAKKTQKICTSYNAFHLKEFSQNSFSSFEPDQPIAMLLNKLPNGYPTNQIYVNGIAIQTSKFIQLNEQMRLAYFLNNNDLTIVDLDRIDGISF
uniref:hypothetical protein n=1 Tax=Priestia megaterium TaxID=1404 RepID=UPI003F49863A